MESGFDLLVIESAGLCNRCAPHIQGVLAVCVIDNLSGVDTPRKIGPMLKMADLVVITKGTSFHRPNGRSSPIGCAR